MTWATQAIELVKRFDVFIIPLADKNLPAVKFSKDKLSELPPNKRASQESAIIKAWAQRFKAYGVVPYDKCLIMDVDIKDGQNGKASLKYLINNGLPTDTFAVKSPSGGMHFYFKMPNHYTPQLDSNVRVLFEDTDIQEGWDALQIERSTGIDTRHGNGYVAGPESVTPKGAYTVINDTGLADVPSHMQIGKKSFVSTSEVKLAKNETKAFSAVIKENRNNDALRFTMDLRLKFLPDDMVKLIIEERQRCYDNDDGGAPTVEEMWDMYERAGDKVEDITNELLLEYVYIYSSERIMHIETGRTSTFTEFKNNLKNKMVNVETASGHKKVNPADLFMSSIDRQTAVDIVFDPRLESGLVRASTDYGYTEGYYFNKFVSPIVETETGSTPLGDAMYDAFIDLINNVFTDKTDREWFVKWLAIMMFEPEFRPAWHWHIFSNVRGVGKDTLAALVAKLYGKHNVAHLDTHVFTDEFNGELFNCGLAILSDFKPVSASKYDATNSAFKKITGIETYRFRGLYQEAFQKPLSVRFLMLSNSGTDFPVDEGDRRLYKCKSDGVRLSPRTSTLVHKYINPGMKCYDTVAGLDAATENDVNAAHDKIIKYLYKSGWQDMHDQRDCPVTETKQNYMAVSGASYIHTIEEYINHGLFVFKSDVITSELLGIMLKILEVKANPNVVRMQLLERGILGKVFVDTTQGRAHKTIKVPHPYYDHDLDMLAERGSPIKQYVYSVRNHDLWATMVNEKGSRYAVNSYKEIFGQKLSMDNAVEKSID